MEEQTPIRSSMFESLRFSILILPSVAFSPLLDGFGVLRVIACAMVLALSYCWLHFSSNSFQCVRTICQVFATTLLNENSILYAYASKPDQVYARLVSHHVAHG